MRSLQLVDIVIQVGLVHKSVQVFHPRTTSGEMACSRRRCDHLCNFAMPSARRKMLIGHRQSIQLILRVP